MKKVLVGVLALMIFLSFSACDLFDSCARNGHTTKLGLCNRCGNFANEYKSTINNISDELLDATNTISVAVEILYYSTPISTEDMNKFIQEVSNAQRSVGTALTYCGSIEELATLKVYITNMKKALDNVSGNNVNSYWDSFQKNYSTYKANAEKANDLLIEWSKEEILN